MGADDEVVALLVFELPLGALKLNGLCDLVGSTWATFVAGAEVEAEGLLKKEGTEVDWLAVVFSIGLAAGVMEKKFEVPVEVDVVGAVTFSEDGAVTVIFGT